MTSKALQGNGRQRHDLSVAVERLASGVGEQTPEIMPGWNSSQDSPRKRGTAISHVPKLRKDADGTRQRDTRELRET